MNQTDTYKAPKKKIYIHNAQVTDSVCCGAQHVFDVVHVPVSARKDRPIRTNNRKALKNEHREERIKKNNKITDIIFVSFSYLVMFEW